ncbi:protein associated with mitochondrial ATP synthase [Spathaspora passalidarum NRRL Y-27907]|uniref:Protein associated with mitochondrial ATP synthase n=1 Tax=Spathaspora passalidarum (strain NRRL Y-27907 / 11-Y1) TaxID=619300 RepID=G3ANB5_SPAPN|nr:protein associated with mitochondrial ATP synthase [Spathaspora passalidarum NRRL Y-27907]EGW32498.1 protein associated with mitochondrial ATP synthase [Spathaspora passalidarum NRRL Y-27907]
MSAIVSKVTGFVNCAIQKSTQLTNCAVYWGKVGGELAKAVYKKEGLAPPSVQEFQNFYANIFKTIKSSSQREAIANKVFNFQPGPQCAVKAGVYGIQLLAFFSVGEIIGRRQLVGYPHFGEEEHHH